MADWFETATATNGTATATHSAESGYRHVAVRVFASFTGSGKTADLTIDVGGSTQITYTVHDDIELDLEQVVETSDNEKLEAVLGAGGTGVDGNVTLIGNTERVA